MIGADDPTRRNHATPVLVAGVLVVGVLVAGVLVAGVLVAGMFALAFVRATSTS